MNKNIRLLVENLFNDSEKDLLNIDNNEEQTYDIQKSILHQYFPKTWLELREILQDRLVVHRDENADFNDIDVSNITYMGSYLLSGKGYGLFEGLDPHDIDISLWDVSRVTNMSNMFRGCKNFKGRGLDYWNVSNVGIMTMMFNNCESLDVDLSGWNVHKSVNVKLMFNGCRTLEEKNLIPDWSKAYK